MDNVRSLQRIFFQLRDVLTNQQKKSAIYVFLSMLLCSCLELLGVSAIYPFLQIMISSEGVKNKWYIKPILTLFPNTTDIMLIAVLGITIIIVFLAKNAIAIWCYHLQYSFANRIQREASVRMLECYLNKPYEFFLENNSSILYRSVDTDILSVYNILVDVLQILAEMITIILIGIYLFVADSIFAICVLGFTMICFVLVTLFFKGRIKNAGIQFRESRGRKVQCCYQALNGIKEISVMNRRKYFLKQYEENAKMEEHALCANAFIAACPDRIIEVLCIAGFMAVICIRLLFYPDTVTFIPVIGAFAMGAMKILPSISKISSRVNDIVYNQFGLQNYYDNVMERQEECHENENDKEVVDEFSISYDKYNQEIFTKQIVIKDVVWQYRNSRENVLNGIELQINKGESIALIGSSGSGKTTLIDVILGLLKPQSGDILVDDRSIFSVSDRWAKNVGYVPQAVYLVDDTIRANVAFGLPRNLIDDDKIWKALEQGQLAEFVRNMPDGLDTLVGERGVKLSGGQRQRIAIARALYEDPDILVLDEATSALDNDTESAVMEAVARLQGSKTLLIVAHRLSTIRNCDRIYEIIDGRVCLRNREDVLCGIEDK